MFEPRQKGGAKNFLGLKKDGDSAVGVFRGEVQTFYQHWSAGRGVVCTRATGCALCEKGEKGGFRFRVNFIVSEDGELKAKVFEGGGKVYDSLVALKKDGLDFDTHRVKITRSGQGKDTTYSILPVMKNGELTKDDIKAIGAVELNSLGTEESEEDAA